MNSNRSRVAWLAGVACMTAAGLTGGSLASAAEPGGAAGVKREAAGRKVEAGGLKIKQGESERPKAEGSRANMRKKDRALERSGSGRKVEPRRR